MEAYFLIQNATWAEKNLKKAGLPDPLSLGDGFYTPQSTKNINRGVQNKRGWVPSRGGPRIPQVSIDSLGTWALKSFIYKGFWDLGPENLYIQRFLGPWGIRGP